MKLVGWKSFGEHTMNVEKIACPDLVPGSGFNLIEFSPTHNITASNQSKPPQVPFDMWLWHLITPRTVVAPYGSALLRQQIWSRRASHSTRTRLVGLEQRQSFQSTRAKLTFPRPSAYYKMRATRFNFHSRPPFPSYRQRLRTSSVLAT